MHYNDVKKYFQYTRVYVLSVINDRDLILMIYFAVYQIYRSKSVGVWISDGRSQKNLPDFTESASTCCSARPETPATRLTGPALRVTTDGTYRRSTSTTWMYCRWVNDFTALVNFFLCIIKLHII